jgi:hypothetical protein
MLQLGQSFLSGIFQARLVLFLGEPSALAKYYDLEEISKNDPSVQAKETMNNLLTFMAWFSG